MEVRRHLALFGGMPITPRIKTQPERTFKRSFRRPGMHISTSTSGHHNVTVESLDTLKVDVGTTDRSGSESVTIRLTGPEINKGGGHRQSLMPKGYSNDLLVRVFTWKP